MSEALSALDQFRLENAAAMADRVSAWVEPEGFQELVQKMPTLHAAGFIAVDRFLNDKGLSELRRDPIAAPSVYHLKELFYRLECFGYDTSYAAGNVGGWMHNTLNEFYVDGAHAPHQDDDGTHAFFLNVDIPSVAYAYVIQPTGRPVERIAMQPKQLVVMDGNHEQNKLGLPRSVMHHVEKPLVRRDGRKRIMYVHERGRLLKR